MKNILITGSHGFIGSALSTQLEKMGFTIITFNSADGDISDFNFISKFENVRIDYVFHLAAKSFIPDSWNNPLKFYKTSILGTGNILEFCRVRNIPLTFVSAYLYGEPNQLPISESDKINANNPYAHSKFLAEELCKFYSENFNIKISIARPFNIYGIKKFSFCFFPYIIKQLLVENEIKVKDLTPKRDYLYLDDLIDGLIKTMGCQHTFSVFNFGSSTSISVKEIIETIQEIMGTNKKVIDEKIRRKNEIMDVVADIRKAKEELDWTPKISFKDGIKYIISDLRNE